MVKINKSNLSYIAYRPVGPSDYVWYEEIPTQYGQRHWLIAKIFGKKVLVPRQDKGWCYRGGLFAGFVSDEKLVEYGYIISYQDGIKTASTRATATVYLNGKKCGFSKIFNTNEEMFDWIADFEAEAGQSLIDIK
jgi:hypothetical protein